MIIQLIGARRAAILGLVILANAILAGLYFSVLDPMDKSAEAQVAAAQADIASLQGQIQGVKQDLEFYKNNLPRYEGLKATGFMSNQDRFEMGRTLEAVQKEAEIAGFAYAIDDLRKIKNADAETAKLDLIASRIQLDKIAMTTDADFFRLADVMQKTFPDQLRLVSFSLKKETAVDKAALRQIEAGQQVNFVTAMATFDWLTVVPQEAPVDPNASNLNISNPNLPVSPTGRCPMMRHSVAQIFALMLLAGTAAAQTPSDAPIAAPPVEEMSTEEVWNKEIAGDPGPGVTPLNVQKEVRIAQQTGDYGAPPPDQAANAAPVEPETPADYTTEQPADDTPLFTGSLFLNQNELSEIMIAKSNAVNAVSSPDGSAAVPVVVAPGRIAVSGVFYRKPGDWVVWINGQKVTPDMLLPEIKGISVVDDRVKLKWFDLGINAVITIEMRPHQVYDIGTGVLLPG